jgi:hypothetical protein
VGGRTAQAIHNREPDADGAIRIRRGDAAHRRSRVGPAAVVIEPVEREDGARLHHSDGDHVAVRLQLPVEHAHRLRGRIDGETESGDAGGGEDAADVSHAMSYRQAVQTQQSR